MPTHLKLFIKIHVSLSNPVFRKYEIIKSDENDKSVEGLCRSDTFVWPNFFQGTNTLLGSYKHRHYLAIDFEDSFRGKL